MFLVRLSLALLLALVLSSTGCDVGEKPPAKTRAELISEFQALNETNVAKVRTLFEIYASRHENESPTNQEQLLEFLREGTVDKNLENLGIKPNELESVFASERDGKQLKIKWGIEMDPDYPKAIAFETVGLKGVRLVAADVVIQVRDEQEYQDLWDGFFPPDEQIRNRRQPLK